MSGFHVATYQGGGQSFEGARSSRSGRGFRGGSQQSRYTYYRKTSDDGDKEMKDVYRFHNRGGIKSKSFRRGGSAVRIDLDTFRRMGQMPIVNTTVKQVPDDWFKIVLTGVRDAEPKAVLAALTATCPVQFKPLHYNTDHRGPHFYVRGRPQANALRSLSKKVSLPDGHKISILSIATLPQNIPITSEQKAIIRSVMSLRYKADMRFLDLSNFYKDAALIAHHLSLQSKDVAEFVIAVIRESCADVAVIDLCGNNLHSEEFMGELSKVAPNLTMLSMKNCNIRTVADLEKLRGLRLEDVNLEGNSIERTFPKREDFIKAVRKIFPRLKQIDGKTLPKQVAFDTEELTLPKKHGNLFCDENAKDLVMRFLQQFFKIYDDGRESLPPAYHDDAVFTVTTVFGGSVPRYDGVMFRQNLNLSIASRWHAAGSCMKRGKSQVITCLKSFPKTEHNLKNAVIDLPITSANLIAFTIKGLVKEISGVGSIDKPIVRGFFRSMVCIPCANGGLVIANDQLTYMGPTKSQLASASHPTPSSSPVLAIHALTVTDNSPTDKVQMVAAFSRESGMNISFSEMCLQEAVWDYQQAGKLFLQAKERGGIPPEAFSTP